MPDPVLNRNAKRFVPVAATRFGRKERLYLTNSLRSNWISQGRMVERFEREFSAAVAGEGASGIACNSGTTALQLALREVGVGPGSVVWMPVMTMVAVPNAVLHCGAIPVFLDVDHFDGNIQSSRILTRIGSVPKTIVVPHLYGVPTKAAVQAARDRFGVTVVQDCAESHYATFQDGSPLLGEGSVGAYSYYSNKIITTGEGGMVVLPRGRSPERLRSLRAHAFTPGDHFNHQELAYGFRMTDLQASIGLAQHERRESLLRERARIAELYRELLGDVPWVRELGRTTGSVWWVYPILVPIAMRDKVREVLAENGIETRTFFRPLSLQSHLRDYADSNYPVAMNLWRRGLYLPLFPGMSHGDVEYVVSAIRSVASHFRF